MHTALCRVSAVVVGMVGLGAGCTEQGVSVYNTAPVVQITAPASGASYRSADLIELAGRVADDQGVEQVQVTWESSLSGLLGEGMPDAGGQIYLAVTDLIQGTHVITVTAVDPGLLTASDAISLQVGGDLQDLDGDGYAIGADCDDDDPDIHPGAEEIAWDEVDQDCDGADLHDYVSLSAGGWFTCGVRTVGGMRCWGSNYFGQVTDAPTSTPSQHDGGGNHACALSTSGAVACWGVTDGSDADYGQVRDTPSGQHVQVSAGGAHSCAITTGGGVTCWGWDQYGQAGLPPQGGFARISAGSFHTCALTTGGEVRCWGAQDGGTYDAGQTTGAPSAGTFSDIGAGYLHTCALSAAGAVTCWGLDDGSRDDEGQVSDAPTAAGFAQLSVGLNHACALDGDGAITCWGDNVEGQVSGAPEDDGYLAIATGSHHSCALDAQRRAVCWGDSSAGQSSPP